MRIVYDKEADVLVIRLSRRRPDGGCEVRGGVVVMTTADGEIVEIEIRQAGRRVSPHLLRNTAA
jgi:uncharacterized protein YuzE